MVERWIERRADWFERAGEQVFDHYVGVVARYRRPERQLDDEHLSAFERRKIDFVSVRVKEPPGDRDAARLVCERFDGRKGQALPAYVCIARAFVDDVSAFVGYGRLSCARRMVAVVCPCGEQRMRVFRGRSPAVERFVAPVQHVLEKLDEPFVVRIKVKETNLEQKLQSDKDFVRRLDEAGLPYDDVNSLLDGMEKLEVRDEDFDRNPSMTEIVLRCVCLLLFLPAAFLAAWPSLLCWIIPEYFTRKVGDKMLRASFLVALNVLFILPICGLITLIATWIRKNFLSAIIYASLLPFICCFEWYYWKLLKSTVSVIKYYKAEKAGQIAPLKELRRKVHSVFSQI